MTVLDPEAGPLDLAALTDVGTTRPHNEDACAAWLETPDRAVLVVADGDGSEMSRAWSHSETVTAMHPIGGEQVGWDAVKESFDQVAGIASGGHVEIADQEIQTGEDLAYELGTERGQFKLAGETIAIEQRVTNIYRREGGEWKLVHHHTDLSPAMLGVLERLQAA
jgi:ketosteroid isomerase-like protein